MTIDDARALLYQAGLNLVNEGLVARTWGNISVRLDEKRFLITPSGRTYEALTPQEMVVVDIESLEHEGDLKPSSEKGMHAEVYKMRPEVQAVVHTHQLQASTVAAARSEVTGLSKEHAECLGESIRCAAYALPGTKKLKLAAASALEGGRNAALLANHGALCIGATMDDAFIVAKTLEDACAEYIRSSYANKTQESVPQDAQDATRAMHESYLKTIASPGGAA